VSATCRWTYTENAFSCNMNRQSFTHKHFLFSFIYVCACVYIYHKCKQNRKPLTWVDYQLALQDLTLLIHSIKSYLILQITSFSHLKTVASERETSLINFMWLVPSKHESVSCMQCMIWLWQSYGLHCSSLCMMLQTHFHFHPQWLISD
jgi:hypothetical protein